MTAVLSGAGRAGANQGFDANTMHRGGVAHGKIFLHAAHRSSTAGGVVTVPRAGLLTDKGMRAIVMRSTTGYAPLTDDRPRTALGCNGGKRHQVPGMQRGPS